jgi:hypothetical protein
MNSLDDVWMTELTILGATERVRALVSVRVVLIMERAAGAKAAAFLDSRNSAMMMLIPPFLERFEVN